MGFLLNNLVFVCLRIWIWTHALCGLIVVSRLASLCDSGLDGAPANLHGREEIFPFGETARTRGLGDLACLDARLVPALADEVGEKKAAWPCGVPACGGAWMCSRRCAETFKLNASQLLI